ncbi:hypothetical protein QTP88_021084 [Uroleucon formosanum]
MGLVDKTDMMMSFNGTIRKSVKWYKNFFFHLLDIEILNSGIIYNKLIDKKLSLPSYRLQLITQILEKHSTQRSNLPGRKSTNDNPTRLAAYHFPSIITLTGIKKKFKKNVMSILIHCLLRKHEKTPDMNAKNATNHYVLHHVLKHFLDWKMLTAQWDSPQLKCNEGKQKNQISKVKSFVFTKIMNELSEEQITIHLYFSYNAEEVPLTLAKNKKNNHNKLEVSK